MKLILFLFSFISVICLVEEKSLFFYEDTHHTWYVNEKDNVYTIINAKDFNVTHGYAFARYEREGLNIMLLSYIFAYDPDANVKAFSLTDTKTSYNDCPLFQKKVVIAAYRVQHRNNQPGCNSVETVRRYLEYYDSHLRLLSGNRVRVDFEKSVISNVCCPCDEETCYAPANYGNFVTTIGNDCNKLDPHMDTPRMTRMFISDGFGGVAGMGTVGNINSYANFGNYWCVCMVNSEPTVDWHWSYQLSVVIHELGHTMGFGHAGFTESNPTYFLKDYSKPDNYGDGGNVMGGGAFWDTIVGPIQYYNIFSNKKVEPFYFRTAAAGTRKTIRLFAWDHPYSRPFLGIEEPRYSDDELIDGIAYENNMMTYEFPYNREDMCSTVSELVSYGSFYLEYRNKYGKQTGAGNRGVRLIQGRVNREGGIDSTRSILLSAGVDGLFSWGDAVIPFGVLWVPPNADRGTIGVQIKKLHSVRDTGEERLLDDEVQPLSSIPYMDIEVTYSPSIVYIPPLHPSPLPSYSYAPTINSCQQNDNSTGWICSMVGQARFWFNMKAFAHRGHPRVWNHQATQWWDSASSSVVSFEGRGRLAWTHFYGDYSRGRCSVVVERTRSSGSIATWINTELYKKKISDPDTAFQLYDKGDFVFVSGFDMTTGDHLFLIDLYGYEEELKPQTDNQMMMKLPTRSLPGYYEGFIVKKRDNKIVFSQTIQQYHSTVDEERLAVELLNSTSVIISSVGMGVSSYSIPSMFHSQTLAKNQQLPVFLQDWNHGDYVFIDFEGKLSRNLEMSIDSDDGVIIIDLKRLGGLSDVTLKISFTQLINRGSVDGQIHYIWFNHGTTVRSIRPVVASNVGNSQGKQDPKQDHYNLDTTRYRGVIGGFTGYVAKEYSSKFDGVKYKVSTEIADQYVVNMPDESPLSVFIQILIWIGVIVVVVMVVVLLCMFVKCVQRKNSSTSSKKQLAKGKTPVKKSATPSPSSKPAPPPSSSKPAPPPSSSKPSLPSSPKPVPPPSSSKPLPPPPSSSKPALPSSSKPLPPPPSSKPLPSPPSSSKSSPPPPPSKPTKSNKSTKSSTPSKPTKPSTPSSPSTPSTSSKPTKSSNPFDNPSFKKNHVVVKPPKSPFKPVK